jgi:iron complex transport system permease protein
MKTSLRNSIIIAGSLVILLLMCLVSFYIGRYPISPSDLFRYVFWGEADDPNLVTVLTQIRFPRIIAAIAAGGALSIAGAAYQGMFRNPMVSPDILGVTAGSGLGAALAILLSLPVIGVQIFSFIGGLSSVLLAVSISKSIGKGHDVILVLVLSGMVISSLCGAMLSLVKYMADPDDKLPAITYWLMGSLSAIRTENLFTVVPLVAVGVIPLILVSWKLNVLSFGEDEARSLGIQTNVLRAIVIVAASLITATIVSVSGIIGWVGLLVPHVTRMITGPNHRILLPASFLFGAIFLLIVDNVARSLTSAEIPIGILTSVIGAPFFLFFLKKSKKSW